MKKCYLDTSILLGAVENKIDLLEEIKRIMNEPYHLIVLDKTNNELKNLGSQSAKITLKFIEHKIEKEEITIKNTEGEEYVDLQLLKIATPNDILATADKELKEKAKNKGIKVITLRGKSTIDFA